jgi:GT2 family glycosyltransferase
MKMIKFSIIVPTYNHLEDCLKPCLESIVAGTNLEEVEIIVVMNGCVDGTKEYLSTFRQPLITLDFDKPIGYPKAINAGLRIAKGDYIILLNNDVQFLNWAYKGSWIDQLIEPFKLFPNCGITGCLKSYNERVDREFVLFFCAMISRQCFNNVGYLNEIFTPGSGEDIDYCIRAAKKGFVFEQVPYGEVGQVVDRRLITSFPIYHEAEKTVHEIPNWSEIFQRNLDLVANLHRFPKISIIIPTYNHLDDYLKPCCESIIKNTNLKNVEIIIVANGCVDKTREYVESLSKPFKLVWFEQALGYTRAINEGLKVAQGEYVVLLNNDVVLLNPTWIELLLKPFLICDNVGITGPLKFTWPCGPLIKTAIAFWCCMIRRSIIDEIGYLDEDFSPGMGEDGAYCIEMEDIGYKIVQVPVDDVKKFGEGPSNQTFPIWHKGNGTFADQEDKKNEIINRNSKILENKYADALQQSYNHCVNAFSDTYALFPILRKYANRCEHITEFGVRDVFSTWAFVAAKPVKMISYDIYTSNNIYGVINIAKGCGVVDYKFIEHNVLTTEIEETDLLFIDTLHTYGQLSQELKLHANKVRKYIMFHDTFTWREKDEIETTTEKKGLYTAIKEFLQDNPQWQPELDISESHGLFVMKRIPTFSIIVPTCNNKNVLKECLDRILSYTNLMDKEIIVAANGCDSDTLTYLYSLRKKISIVNFGEKVGQIRPVNEGVRVSKGKYIVLIDDDCLLLPQEKDSWIKMLYQPFIDQNVGVSGPIVASYPDLGYAMHSGCTMYKREVWEKVNGADPIFDYGYLWDADISYRIEKENYKIAHVGFDHGFMEFPLYHPESPATTERKQRDGVLLKRNRDILYERHGKKKEENVKISIVIPTYNHLDDCLRPCVESIIQHTNLENVEVLIVANGCKDGTREYIESLGKPFKLIWEDDGIGFTKATNIGIKQAKGEYVILLNNDTIFLDKGQSKNTWIEMLIKPFKEDDKVGITGPLQLYDNYAGYDVMIFFCVMIRKEVFDKIGILDESYSPGGGEDIDFCVRAMQAGYKQVVVPSKHTTFTFTNEGYFPIYHIGEGTFSDKEFPEYGKEIIKRNGLKNAIRYNKHLKLNLGSGGVEMPGYLSVDMKDRRAHIVSDVFDLQLPDNSVEEILASHLLEHISVYRVMDLFGKWIKILKPGGKLVMEMPDILGVCRALVAATKEERYGWLTCIYGAVNTTDVGTREDITSPHLWGWYDEHLWDHLSNAGFVNIKFMPEQIPHPFINFRVECNKPI